MVRRYRYPVHIVLVVLLLAGVILLAGCTGTAPDSGAVRTESGLVSGTFSDGVRAYLGIPYAAPPTGDLRWRPPVPPPQWQGTRQATAFGAACPQLVPADTSAESLPGNMSEDCLYLNVWTPARSGDEKLPVMVFIHGGSFLQGAGSMPLYNGTSLAKKGVVLVNLNYRLGPLGFLAHPALANESPVHSSGNYGLEDQAAALRWVKNNIAGFGGDPDRITIFGESAGGASILVHLAGNETRGLYRQAIVESGPLWTNGSELNIISTKAEAEQYGDAWAQGLGYAGPDAIARMRGVDAWTLVNATPWSASAFRQVHTLRFKPVIDGWLIPEDPEKIFLEGRQNPVPLIIGTNSDEGSTLATNVGLNVTGYEQYIRKHFGEYAPEVLQKYPAATPAEVQQQMERIMTDVDFSAAAAFVAGSQAKLNRNTYLYRFSYVLLPESQLGAFHGEEIFFVFRPAAIVPDPAGARVSDTMQDAWTRFARSGDPAGGNLTWPQYTRENGSYLDFGAEPVVKGGY
ncbi:MAG: carboxylesterase/lipase family protein [Methanoregula sp.]|jgi:para-nitrobenzyl esterase|uniref:carboxylesterase/lipase family protein n=1 Tax=Methanoregula sp. TaxID=2052170 RepID=UPI003D0EDD14